MIANCNLFSLKLKLIIRLTFWQSPHGDMDHLGNSEYLINNFKLDKLIINDNEINKSEENICKIKRCYKLLEEQKINLEIIKLLI